MKTVTVLRKTIIAALDTKAYDITAELQYRRDYTYEEYSNECYVRRNTGPNSSLTSPGVWVARRSQILRFYNGHFVVSKYYLNTDARISTGLDHRALGAVKVTITCKNLK